MIKKIYILVVLLFTFVTVCYANTNYNVKLSIDENLCENKEITNYRDKIKFDICFNVTEREDDTGKQKVEVNFKTADDSNYDLVLFDNNYNEQDLKSLFPKKNLKFDGSYPGMHKIEKSDNVKNNFYIEAGNDMPIMTLDLDEDVDALEEGSVANKIQLSIYAVEHKTKRFLFWSIHEYNIVEIKDITFNVNVISPIVHDSIADIIIENYNNLIYEIENRHFCNNSKHEPTIEKQKEEYQLQIDTLKQQLDSIIEKGSYNSYTKGYYEEQKSYMYHNIDSMDLTIQDCNQHTEKREKRVIQRRRCDYCNLSLKKIREDLEKIRLSLYGKTEEEKTQIIRTVKTMYNCAKEHKDWGVNSICNDIDEYYKKIVK